MSIHVVLTGAIYHGGEWGGGLCFCCWKASWLNFYLALWKRDSEGLTTQFCVSPFKEAGRQMGGGAVEKEGCSDPSSLCPSVLNREEAVTRSKGWRECRRKARTFPAVWNAVGILWEGCGIWLNEESGGGGGGGGGAKSLWSFQNILGEKDYLALLNSVHINKVQSIRYFMYFCWRLGGNSENLSFVDANSS